MAAAARDPLARLSIEEIAGIGRDLGLSPSEIAILSARGAGAASLLYERMAALGLAATDIQKLGNGVLRDLERTCSECDSKAVCARDLEHRPDDPRWQGYCHNSDTLTAVHAAKAEAAPVQELQGCACRCSEGQ
jgi:hypothetical protein